MSLKDVYDILEEIAFTTKKKEKEAIIKKYKKNKNFKKVAFYAYDPYKRYHTTSVDYVATVPPGTNQTVRSIFAFLDTLSKQTGASNADKEMLSNISSIDEETANVVSRIVSKDLRCGCSKRTFKKVYKNLPYFEIMTCKDDLTKFLGYAKKEAPKGYVGSNVLGSLKKDGVRTWNIVYQNRTVEHISRKGLEYPNFGIFDSDMLLLTDYLHRRWNIQYPIRIDGEAMDPTGKFNNLMSNVRRLSELNEDIFEFNIFDIVLEDGTILKDRYGYLVDAFQNLHLKRTKLIEHWNLDHYKFEYEFHGLMNWATNELGDEGIVLKIANSVYELKEKSSYWCKQKPTYTFDLPVVGHYMGKKGKKHEKRLGGLIVLYKGTEVRIGGGYSDQQREDFLKEKPSIIEVCCKEVTPDGSLREPRFIRVRDDKDTVDGEEE